MGWGIIPSPTNDRKVVAPCLDSCAHLDCLESKEFVEKPCDLCGKKIGYETKYYLTDHGTNKGQIHFLCAFKKAEKDSRHG